MSEAHLIFHDPDFPEFIFEWDGDESHPIQITSQTGKLVTTIAVQSRPFSTDDIEGWFRWFESMCMDFIRMRREMLSGFLGKEPELPAVPTLAERMVKLADELWREGDRLTARRSYAQGVAYRTASSAITKVLRVEQEDNHRSETA